MTIALPAEAERRPGRIDLSRPILLLFAAVLCVLIVLPMSWLVYYSFVDRTGAFTLGNFGQIFTDPVFLDPLMTTVIIAVSSSLFCCIAAAPMSWLVARTDMRCAAVRAGDRVLRDAAIPGAIAWELLAARTRASSTRLGAPRRARDGPTYSTSIRSPASSL
jgi:iron(III) transport system permease protein